MVAQCSVFIVFDPHMREGPDGEAARARNSDIVEDLGMVEYVFSDKTGTLTSNEMQLRMLAVKGRPFGRPDFRFAIGLTDLLKSNTAATVKADDAAASARAACACNVKVCLCWLYAITFARHQDHLLL